MKKMMVLLVCMVSVGISYSAVIVDINFDQHSLNQQIATNTGMYDYTRNAAFVVGTTTTTNSLVFKAGSGTSYTVQNRGVGHERALYLNGAMTLGAASDNGIYLLKMDMTGNGANSSQMTRVSWSFDILGTSSDVDMNTLGWTVRLNYGNTSESINVTDAWFTNSTSKLVQTFDFVNAGIAGTTGWTTVSGYYDIPVGAAGKLGSIQIRSSAGGYLGGGTGAITVDNILVDVAVIPEPTTISLLSIGALGSLLLRRVHGG
jgi:hypothetical protein